MTQNDHKCSIFKLQKNLKLFYVQYQAFPNSNLNCEAYGHKLPGTSWHTNYTVFTLILKHFTGVIYTPWREQRHMEFLSAESYTHKGFRGNLKFIARKGSICSASVGLGYRKDDALSCSRR